MAQDYPFKNQKINPIQNSNAPDRPTTPEIHSKQNSSCSTNNTYWHLLVPRYYNQNGSIYKEKRQYDVKNVSFGEIILYLINTGSSLSIIPEPFFSKI